LITYITKYNTAFMKKKRSFIMGCLLLVAMLPYTFFASAQTKVTVK